MQALLLYQALSFTLGYGHEQNRQEKIKNPDLMEFTSSAGRDRQQTHKKVTYIVC